jgi:phosphoglycerate kinase
MRKLRTIRDVGEGEWKGKRVLVRVDCNVATDEEGNPISGGEQRLQAILPTLAYLRDRGARLVLLTHLGRPDGRVVEALRVDDVARRLGVLLHTPVQYVPDIVGEDARAAVRALDDGGILLLENLRFDVLEEAADPVFARALADLGDLVVEEDFGVAHRNHASVAVLPRLLPSYAGFLLAREVETLSGVLERPAHPVVAIVGGAKLETKLALLKNLLPRVDQLLTGGGIANTLLRITGTQISASLTDHEMNTDVHALWETYREKITLPTDLRVARGGNLDQAVLVPLNRLLPADDVLDVGPETVVAYCRALTKARTCIWNGQLGKFELPAFALATRAVAQCVRGLETFAVAGGGDTVRALTEMGLLDHFDHVSTGGGAMLAFLEGAPMPGLDPLY